MRHVLHTLLRRNLLPAEHAVTKIKRFFANGGPAAYQNSQMVGSDGEQMDQQSVKVHVRFIYTLCAITNVVSYTHMKAPNEFEL